MFSSVLMLFICPILNRFFSRKSRIRLYYRVDVILKPHWSKIHCDLSVQYVLRTYFWRHNKNKTWLHIEPPKVGEIILLVIFRDKLFEANLTSVQLPSFCEWKLFQDTFYNVFLLK